MKTRFRLLAAVAALVALAGCSDPNADDYIPDRDGRTDTGGGDAGDTGGGDGSDVPLDSDYVPTDGAGDGWDDSVCDEQNFEMHHEIVRMMLLLDQSSSMSGTSWRQATDALETLLTNPRFNDMYFGLDAFPDGYPGAWGSCGALCLSCRADECGTEFPPQVPVDICYRSRDAIIAHMNDSSYPQFCTFTPLVDQMAWYDSGAGPTGAPEMYLDDGDNYLVVVSDGQDEGCFSGSPASALGTHARNILTNHDLKSIAIGFRSTSGELAAQLNAIASNGGTSFASFIPAEDGTALASALETIASSVITCDYVLDAVDPSAEPEQVNFYLPDGTVIPMEEGCTETSGEGWHWVDDEHTTVEFCGDLCTAIKAGEIGNIRATFGCPTILL